jgi:hypothetical protein
MQRIKTTSSEQSSGINNAALCFNFLRGDEVLFDLQCIYLRCRVRRQGGRGGRERRGGRGAGGLGITIKRFDFAFITCMVLDPPIIYSMDISYGFTG